MAKKTNQKSNNRLLFWVFAALLVLITISIITILVLNNQSNPNSDDNFFVSNDSKYVVISDAAHTDESDSPIASYDVYYHDSEGRITNHQAYYEFTSEEAAQSAIVYYENLGDNDIESVKLDGKYIVLTADKSQYDGITIDDIKNWSSTDTSTTEDTEPTDIIEIEVSE